MDNSKEKFRLVENEDSIDVGVELYDHGVEVTNFGEAGVEVTNFGEAGKATLLNAVSLDASAAVAGCDSRCFRSDINNTLDLDIVMDDVVGHENGPFIGNGPRIELTYIKYNVELPHFALLHAGAIDDHEKVLHHLRWEVSFLDMSERGVNASELAASLLSYLNKNPDRIARVDEKEFVLIGVEKDADKNRSLQVFRVGLTGGVVRVPYQSSVSVGVGREIADPILAQIDYSAFSRPTDEETRDLAIESVSTTVYDAISEVCKVDYNVGGDINVIIFRLGREGLEYELRRYPQRGYSFYYWEEQNLKRFLAKDMLKVALGAIFAEERAAIRAGIRING